MVCLLSLQSVRPRETTARERGIFYCPFLAKSLWYNNLAKTNEHNFVSSSTFNIIKSWTGDKIRLILGVKTCETHEWRKKINTRSHLEVNTIEPRKIIARKYEKKLHTFLRRGLTTTYMKRESENEENHKCWDLCETFTSQNAFKYLLTII